ncbi:ATPase family AAA domain-containing protein 5b [Tachysurus vachellii]|uniref:ATPase family AAA domain-containing protein 5b n=1 Tax=Tachysurus vachellii TaxID=175792 RepID=UPI00296B0416|nr:ATPase family AAA domain-containing protein 5b [Tachysurus vachellii]
MNRLRRANRIKQSDLVWSEYEVIRPECSHKSTMKDTTPGARRSPPNRGLLLHMKTSLGQKQPEMNSESNALCHQQLFILTDEAGSLRKTGAQAGTSDLGGHEGSKREKNTSLCSYSKSTPPSQSLRLRCHRSSEFFTDAHSREEFLKQVHAQNPRFPVQRLYKTLLKRLGESKSSPVVTATGKRKREEESDVDEHLRKRRRSIQNDSVTINVSEGHVTSGHRAVSRNRLRRKQAPVQDAAVDESRQNEGRVRRDDGVGPEDGVGHDEDVPWTEKFRPRSSDEVVGNEAAVRKLYSWLKEWRIRADVEERRKRREERRMKEESDGSWDCGDFEGDPRMEECEGELCNTLLIHGPTGAGKSAAVFACAEQLGFKVLEVNSSSMRSGRLVLSQLRESTQSHQVGAPQCSVSLSHTPAAASQKEAPQKSVSSYRNPSLISGAASRKKRQKSVTLTRYFSKTGKHVNKHSKRPQDTRAAGEVPLYESRDTKGRTAPISLILFEEVDVVFEEDVGFLTAVKSLMCTTKRPIVLTTNDPSFGESFDGHFEKVRFKTPATESIVSYLQCVCVVQGVKPDPKHIRFMLQENKGDVRKSVLELEMWARSGAGNTHHHLHNRALTCRSYAELEISGCVDVLVDSWRKGRSLFYSNLDLLLAPPTAGKADQSTFDQNTVCTRIQKEINNDASRSDSVKRLKTKPSNPALRLDRTKQTNQSAAEDEGVSKVASVAQFFDTMSFIDSYLRSQPRRTSGPLGARTADGLLDEPREDDEVEMMKTSSLERCYEILAVVEGLGFYRCRTEACPIERVDQDVTGGEERRKTHFGFNLSSEHKCADVIHRALCSKAFRYHSNQTAVLTEYLPCLRFICTEQQHKPRFSHYIREIGLQLPQSLLDLLASPLR